MDVAPIDSETCGLGIYCVRCGYDLRVTPRTGSCPECQERCEASLWIRTEVGQRWRRRMYWGAVWLCAAVAANVFLDWSWSAIYWLGGSIHPYSWTYFALTGEWWQVCLAIGAFLITTPFPPARGHRLWTVPVRFMARWFVILWMIHDVAWPLSNRLLALLADHTPWVFVEVAQAASDAMFGFFSTGIL